MKFPTLSLILLTAACGGGGKDPVVLVDSNGDSGGGAANSKNDMVLFNPTATTGQAALTSQADSPDNQAAPVTLAETGARRFTGEMGIGGDHSDEYFERDTFLLVTGANTNQITVRLDSDSATADLDFVLFKEPATGETEPVEFGSGTLIADTAAEFQTFPVDPSTNYWLWSGVYSVLKAGGAPSLPATYDLSVYGDNFTPAAVGACDFTEAADLTNDNLSMGAPTTNKAETSNQTLSNGKHVFCGTINKGHFVVDPTDPTIGTVDIDSFSLNVSLETKVKITLTGLTTADQTALAGVGAVEYLVVNDVMINNAPVHQFFTRGFFQNTHGVLTSTLPLSSTVDTTAGSMTLNQVVGPKAIVLEAFNSADIAANISYKIEVAADVPDTRAPRTSGTADAAEGHDN